MIQMSFETLNNLFGGDDPDLTLVVAGIVLGISVLTLCWLIPCFPDSVSKDDEPYYGPEVIEITKLFVYPVKSCAGHEVQNSEVVRTGLKYDRLWVIIGHDGRFRSQRRLPKMSLIKPSLPTDLSDSLTLTAVGMQDICVSVVRHGDKASKTVPVAIWSDNCIGIDQGDAASEWLSSFLDEPGLRLVRMDENYVRPTDPEYGRGFSAAFSDGFPLLLASEESLEDLNSRLANKVGMDRFRPNIVVRGMSAWDEDIWTKLAVNDIIMRVVKPCSRCKMPNIDQETGQQKGNEPITTLSTFRTGKHLNFSKKEWENDIFFGQNVVCENKGWLKVGDRIDLLRVKMLQNNANKED